MSIITDCVRSSVYEAQKPGDSTTVILTSSETLPHVHRMVSAHMPRNAKCRNGVWTMRNGRSVTVKRYDEIVPNYSRTVDLCVCNDGDNLTPDEVDHVRRWRESVSAVG